MRYLYGFAALTTSVVMVSSARGDLVYQSWTLKNEAKLSANDLHITLTNNDGTSEEPIAIARSQVFADPPQGEGTATVDWPSDNGGSVAPGALIRVAMCNESADFLPDFAAGNVYFTFDGEPVATGFASIADEWSVDSEGHVSYTYRNPAHLAQGDMTVESVRIYENNLLDSFEIADESFAFEKPTGELIFEELDLALAEGEERTVDIGPSDVEKSYVLAVVTLTVGGGKDVFTVATGFQRHVDCLWDNDLLPDGFNARATSPPVFPTIRIADDIVVPAEDTGGWTLQAFTATKLEDMLWTSGDLMEVYIYADSGEECPAELLETLVGPFDRTATGEVLFDREVFEYWTALPDVQLLPGTYFIGSRFPNGGGFGSAFWLTSSGGAHGGTPACFTLDGVTWKNEGEGWDHAFKVSGVVNEGGCTCEGDVNLDCEVTFDDILLILAAWGACPGDCPNDPCPEDVDGDCEVTFDDVLIALGAWGPCSE